MKPQQKTGKPYRYTYLSPQPFRAPYFEFVPRHTHRSSIGYVQFWQFWLVVAGRQYGPYRTDIRTTTTVWQNRKNLFGCQQAKLVAARTGQMSEKLEDGWAAYDAKGEPITGEMILAKSGLKLIQGEGGPVYAV